MEYTAENKQQILFFVNKMAENKQNISGPETLVPQKKGFFPKLIQLWKEGLRTMTWGKPLWILNIIKLFIMFGVLRLFFFPNFLKEQADTEEGRQEYVRNELVQRAIGTEQAQSPLEQNN